MWSKGAVVIVKRGDEAMADAMASSFEEDREKDPLTNEERAWKDLLSQAKEDAVLAKIADAQATYGRNYIPPKWAKKIVEGFAFIVYGISIFVERYLVIR